MNSNHICIFCYELQIDTVYTTCCLLWSIFRFIALYMNTENYYKAERMYRVIM